MLEAYQATTSKREASLADGMSEFGKWMVMTNSEAFKRVLSESKLYLDGETVVIEMPRGRADGEAMHYMAKGPLLFASEPGEKLRGFAQDIGRRCSMQKWSDGDFEALGFEKDGAGLAMSFDLGDRFPQYVRFHAHPEKLTISWPGGCASAFSEDFFQAMGIKVGALPGEGAQSTQNQARLEREYRDMAFQRGAYYASAT